MIMIGISFFGQDSVSLPVCGCFEFILFHHGHDGLCWSVFFLDGEAFLEVFFALRPVSVDVHLECLFEVFLRLSG